MCVIGSFIQTGIMYLVDVDLVDILEDVYLVYLHLLVEVQEDVDVHLCSKIVE